MKRKEKREHHHLPAGMGPEPRPNGDNIQEQSRAASSHFFRVSVIIRIEEWSIKMAVFEESNGQGEFRSDSHFERPSGLSSSHDLSLNRIVFF